MRKNSTFVALALDVAQLLAACAFAQTLQHQGTERAYRLVGEPISDQPRPLIVHLHGFREPEVMANAPDLSVIAWRRLGALAQSEGFFLAQPAALKGRWNMGLDLANIALETGEKADDVGFVFKLVAHLVASGLADPDRVYLSGISDGGIMVNKILCTARHPFRAGASLIGTMVEAHAKKCRNNNAVPVFLLAGTHDDVLPYDGWIFPTGRSLSAPEIADFWRLRHGCGGQKMQMLPDLAKRDYTRVRQIDWTDCNSPVAVRLLRIEGGSHHVPNNEKPGLFKGGWTGKSRDIDAADAVWEFFQAVEGG